eukprot:GEZU01015331.1.p1 GENE.GEZU01015331.1~~GEZU01015331.1.p1  ORF type:complete len:395 (+),score=69.10 GEZU01015331.1:73-1257(+)
MNATKKARKQLELLVKENPNIKDLDLGHKELQTVPRNIGLLKNLVEVDLSRNMIATLPQDLQLLQNLKILSLRRNYLAEFPLVLTNIPSLVDLDLSYNQITKIPESIQKITALKALNMSYNKIQAVPPELGLLASLTAVSLRSNAITTLPPQLATLTALTLFDLSENPLQPPLDELHNQGVHAVLNYLSSLQNEISSQMRVDSDHNNYAITNEEFAELKWKILSESFPEYRIQIVRNSSQRRYFTSSQVKELVSMMPISAYQREIALMLYHQLVDPNKFYLVLSALQFTTDREYVENELKLNNSSSASRFSIQQPEGYYLLDLSRENDRAIVEKLRDLEMKNSGQNIRMVKLNGRKFELFRIDKNIVQRRARGRRGYKISKSYHTHLKVTSLTL